MPNLFHKLADYYYINYLSVNQFSNFQILCYQKCSTHKIISNFQCKILFELNIKILKQTNYSKSRSFCCVTEINSPKPHLSVTLNVQDLMFFCHNMPKDNPSAPKCDVLYEQPLNSEPSFSSKLKPQFRLSFNKFLKIC